MPRSIAALVFALALTLGWGAPTVHADAYQSALQAAVQKYGSPQAVPEGSIRWLAKTYSLKPAAVRIDILLLGPGAEPRSSPASPAPPPPTVSSLRAKVTSAAAAIELPFETETVDPLAIATARGLVAVLFLGCAVFLWAAPRSMKQARSHVREATGWSSFAPRLLALYLGAAGVWELGGVFLPGTFAFGRPFTVFKEIVPPVKSFVARQPLWKSFRTSVKKKSGY